MSRFSSIASDYSYSADPALEVYRLRRQNRLLRSDVNVARIFILVLVVLLGISAYALFQAAIDLGLLG